MPLEFSQLPTGYARLERHPSDGWQVADPLPLRKGTLLALTRVVDAISPMNDGPQSPGLLERTVEMVRVQLAYFPRAVAFGFVLGLLLVDLSPLWTFRGLRRLRSLPRERIVAQLLRLERSRFLLLRQLVFPLRAATLSSYFDQPEVHEAIGYDPMPFLRGRIELHRRLSAGEAGRNQDLIEPRSIHGAPRATVARPHARDLIRGEDSERTADPDGDKSVVDEPLTETGDAA